MLIQKYILNHSHDANKECAEEASFTKEFSEPMVQLESENVIVLLSHSGNTFNKREILVGCTVKINNTLAEVNEPVTKFIKEPYLSQYNDIFYNRLVKDSKYDIVYIAGCFSIRWSPTDNSLGGSEQAIVNLSQCWAKMGKKVAVYGEVDDINYNGVSYFNWKKLPLEQNFNIVILWRIPGIWASLQFGIKAKYIYLDFHDRASNDYLYDCFNSYKINKIFFKSNYHKSQFQCENSKFPCELGNKFAVIPNGVRNIFLDRKNIEKNRQPYRFVYCSCYTRGLYDILRYIWPIIYQNEPQAELHIYYGMNLIRDEKFKQSIIMLMAQPGVMDHGRQSVDIVYREKCLSTFHLYITNNDFEIDCISVKESLALGTIPLISNFGVFKDMEGIHFDITSPEALANMNITFQNIAQKILKIIKDEKMISSYRQNILEKYNNLHSWETIAKKWLDELPVV